MKFRCERARENVCVLDCGRFYLNGKPLGRAREEVLRADRLARAECGYKFRTMIGVQPWRRAKEKPPHTFTAEYEFFSKDALKGVHLALESPETAYVTLNGAWADRCARGWFTDRAIKKIALPRLRAGKNILRIAQPFGNDTDPEACYLLGEFSVEADENNTFLSPPRPLDFGRTDEQGLKFYAQNLDYSFRLRVGEGEKMKIRVPHFEGPVIGVFIDGEDAGNIVFAPYEFTSKPLHAGVHKVKLRLYGDNGNTFSQLHVREEPVWTGDYSWYAEDGRWTYGYRTKPFGILSEPIIEITEGAKN